MNITIDREVLLENLNTISRGLPSKSPMPILTGIKIDATETDLFMTSSDSDLAVEVVISDASLKITEPGKTVVPGKVFIDIIRKIPSRLINLYISEGKSLNIKGDRVEYNLNILDVLDYPNIDFVCLENPLELEAKVLKKMVKSTVFATAQSDKMPILTGVNFKNTNGTLTATATDSFRLAINSIDVGDYPEFNITVPNKSLDELLKAIDQYDEKLSLYFSPNKMLFKFKNVLFQTRLLDGNYRDISKLVNAPFPISIKFNKDELLSAVDRVSILSPKDREKDKELTYALIKLSIKKDRIIEITTMNSTIGNAKEELLPTAIETTQPLVISFSSKYLTQALNSFQSTEVTLCLNSEVKPFIIKGENDPSLTQLILPVRSSD